MKKLAFVVLFLLSSISYGAGKVNIYQNAGNIKTYLMAVKLCGQPIMYIYNHYGKTQVLLRGKLTDKLKKQFKHYASKMPKVGNKIVLPIINLPCSEGISL